MVNVTARHIDAIVNDGCHQEWDERFHQNFQQHEQWGCDGRGFEFFDLFS